jgi:hypothetical protein
MVTDVVVEWDVLVTPVMFKSALRERASHVGQDFASKSSPRALIKILKIDQASSVQDRRDEHFATDPVAHLSCLLLSPILL